MMMGVYLVAANMRIMYDRCTMSDDRQGSFLCLSLWTLFMIILVFSVSIGLRCVAHTGTESTPSDRLPTSIVGIVVLILAIAASGWYFGRPVHKVPFLLGIAAFSAACGIGIGLSPEATFAALVPALAAAFGGALVCAGSTRAQLHKTQTGEIASYASAASGIPLLVGIYFGNSIDGSTPWDEPARLAAVIVILALVIAVGILVGRKTKNTPLSLGAAAFGAFVGMATGLSRYPVVAYVAPATLALFTGVASYAFTAKPQDRRNIGGILLCFSVLLVAGLFLGAITRVGLGWAQAPWLIYAFCALVLTILALGSTVGGLNQDHLSALGFAMLGGGVGLTIGLSRTIVTHIVIPVLLTVFSGLAIYVFRADREDRPTFYRLIGVFAVLVLLGSFVGYSLRQAQLVPLAAVETTDLTIPEAERPGNVSIWLEGSETATAVLIDVLAPLGSVLRVVERVDARVLYEGVPLQGEQLSFSGESLEISWPVAAGHDSLVLTGWDRMVQQAGTWAVVGDGEPIDTSTAEVRGGWFVLVYP